MSDGRHVAGESQQMFLDPYVETSRELCMDATRLHVHLLQQLLPERTKVPMAYHEKMGNGQDVLVNGQDVMQDSQQVSPEPCVETSAETRLCVCVYLLQQCPH